MTYRRTLSRKVSPVKSTSLMSVAKSGIIENVLSWARFKQDQILKKSDGAKRSR